MQEKILTISVAAYQVEQYLDQTLSSFVIPEIMEEIEVLIINDGSRDGTAEIGSRYQEKYPQTFRVINKENGGHGSTINRGIQEAAGMYFKVVDGDDWVEREGFTALLSYLRTEKTVSGEERADVVVTDYQWIEDGTGAILKEIRTDFPGKLYQEKYRFMQVCDKVYINMHAMTYRTDILKAHPPGLDEHCFYVDAEYVLLPLPHIQRIVFLEKPVYLYRLGRAEQSMNIKSMQKNCGDHEKVLQRLLAFYRDMEEAYSGQGDLTPELQAKKHYLAKGAARILASQVKVYLSFPPDLRWKNKILTMEELVRKEYPEIYRANRNRGLWLLRKSRYALYGIASRLLQRKAMRN